MRGGRDLEMTELITAADASSVSQSFSTICLCVVKTSLDMHKNSSILQFFYRTTHVQSVCIEGYYDTVSFRLSVHVLH